VNAEPSSTATTAPPSATSTFTPQPSPSQIPTPAAPSPPASPTFPPTAVVGPTEAAETILYTAQAGDTPRAVAIRFGVTTSDIRAVGGPLPGEGELIDAGVQLLIPRRLTATGPSDKLVPDSEIVFSPNAADFDVSAYVNRLGGYLARYQESVGPNMRTGPEVVAIVARDNSVNPRILLALLEYRAGWITNPARPAGDAWKYPLGNIDPLQPGLFRQLTWLANELGNGYYGWRSGMVTQLSLADGSSIRLAPDLNAGTVALQYYFSLQRAGQDWTGALSSTGFVATYIRLFGDPFANFHPLYEPGIRQPQMILPFLPGHVWAFTGGPHGAWERESAWAALDFAPSSGEPGCAVSDDWVVAAAPGLVLRSGEGVVVLDLDGDGREQTGWELMYLHIADQQRVAAGTFLQQGDLIGHPSCLGGIATGTHVHLARKYNGEWLLADGPLPFTLSGWVAHAGSKPYEGSLVKGDQMVIACTCASQETLISR
jgi:LasA protease